MADQDKQAIDSDMVIDSLLEHYPVSAEVFTGLGMACVGCVFSRFHSIEDAAVIYQLNSEHLLDAIYNRLGWLRLSMSR
jgi:hybrid cluster-associated redox disulfide protein